MMDASEATLRDWAIRLRRSDASAATELFDTFYPDLFRYARTIAGSDEAAKDAIQEAFLRLWEMRHRLDPDRSLVGLILITVRNEARDTTRRSFNRVNYERVELHQSPTAAETVDGDQLAAKIRVWIDGMPPRRREAFHLSRVTGLTYAEIALVMEVSIRTVENHIRLALLEITDRIREYEPSLLKP